MQVVARERVDGEPVPLLRTPGGPRSAGSRDASYLAATVSAAATSSSDDGRVLQVVALGHGGLVLVPVGEERVVLVEHQREPLGERRCTSRTWQAYSSGDHVSPSGAAVASGRRQQRRPAVGVGAHQAAEVGRSTPRRRSRTPGRSRSGPRSSPWCRACVIIGPSSSSPCPFAAQNLPTSRESPPSTRTKSGPRSLVRPGFAPDRRRHATEVAVQEDVRRSDGGQVQPPGVADQVLAEEWCRSESTSSKPRRLVDPAGGGEDVAGPERRARAAGRAGVGDARRRRGLRRPGPGRPG